MDEPTPVTGPARAGLYSFTVVILLSAVYTFNFLDRQLLSILSEPIRKELNLSYTEIGMLTGLTFALFYTTFGIPLAWLADRTHRVRIIAAACTLWSLFSMACGLATSFTSLALARIGVGVGEAGGSPPSYALISDYFPPRQRGLAMAIYSLGVPFGTGLGSLLGARVAALYGWRMAFFAVGAPGVLLGLLVLLVIREPKRGRMDVLADGETDHAAAAPLLATIAAVLRNRTLVITALSSALSAFVGYGTLNNAPAYLMSNKGMSLTEISLYYAAASGIAGGFGTFASGFLVDLFGKKNRTAYALVPAAMTLTGLPFFIAFLFAPTWQTAMLCLVIPLTFGTAYLPAAIAVAQNAAAPAQRGTTSAILLFILNIIGLGGGPVYVGLVADHFKPTLGTGALQYGLLALVPVYLLTILALVAGAWSISKDSRLAAQLGG
jgi:MFS family permease